MHTLLRRAAAIATSLALAACAQRGDPDATQGNIGRVSDALHPGVRQAAQAQRVPGANVIETVDPALLRQLQADDETCRSYGFQPGTRDYGACRIEMERIRASRAGRAQ